MRNTLPICILVIISLFLFSGQSLAGPFGLNITIWDKMGSNPLENENNEVEPGDIQAQKWDLEGFFLNGNSLTMIGGFDFLNGASDGTNTWLGGDIFISTNPGSVIYGNPPVNNSPTFGYTHVFDMDYDNLTYQLYGITQNTVLSNVHFSQNAGSNPYQYVGGGTLITSGSFQFSDNPDLTGLGLQPWYNHGPDTHYSLMVDLTFLPQDTDFLAHFTEQCGNDTLVGWGQTPGSDPAVPEPTTIALVGTGLIAIIGFGRYKRSRSNSAS